MAQVQLDEIQYDAEITSGADGDGQRPELKTKRLGFELNFS